ncbi:GTP-binding protein Era [Desulfofundulus thermosubterraneus DSM 16057]|uniref:GTPase Era n=1 Tax=Desulfofundulus thermosubterraneus DSM 16057 TaxID=1121432 RepID=A0A1M6A856_9FIRM|nr:GTP-binding protein Era [Desulfofundulus thermosubterraneus DSM 16057]
MEQEKFKSGFVAIIGRPNVGKSTLLNQLVGHKVAIMSDKPQTTRHKIHSIITRDDAQIIFLDTPGIHKPRHKLGEYMVEVALGALKEVDVILFLVEPQLPGPGDEYIINQLREVTTPVILVINKIDLLENKAELLPLIDVFRQKYNFAEIVPVSALKPENLDHLVELVVSYLPYGPKYYPDNMVTDRPEQFIMAELIREKVLHLTTQEVPHGVAVVVEEIEPRSDQLLYVRAVIYTEKESHKAILIGKGGRMLKEIGRLAREEMELLLGSKIYLDLWVKVKEDWRNQDLYLRNFGYAGRD